MKYAESVKSFIPKSLKEYFYIEHGKFNDLSWAEGSKYCYIVYLTAYQGQRDKLYKITLKEWKDLVDRFGNKEDAMQYVFEEYEPTVCSHRIL